MELNLAFQQPSSSVCVQTYRTNLGAEVYRLPVEVFPGFWANVYLVLVDGLQVLMDAGSGFGHSNQHLVDRLEEVEKSSRHRVGMTTITHVLITHSHIDHFGGLPFILANGNPQIGVHELDLRNLTNTVERLAIVAHRLDQFLMGAGVSPDQRSALVQMYKLTKLEFTRANVDFTYEAVGMQVGPFEILHMPGHCAGQVVIRLHDVLFSGDHILADISPHMAPERLVLNTGLQHYLNSLSLLKKSSSGIRLTLPGHNGPISDLNTRIDEIVDIHKGRLGRVADILSQPGTILEVARQLFPNVHGYNELLALEEAGAHVEYLYQRGLLSIKNLDEFLQGYVHTPIQYHRI